MGAGNFARDRRKGSWDSIWDAIWREMLIFHKRAKEMPKCLQVVMFLALNLAPTARCYLEPPDGKPNHFIGAKSMGRNGIRKIRATDVVIHDEYLDALCDIIVVWIRCDLKAQAGAGFCSGQKISSATRT